MTTPFTIRRLVEADAELWRAIRLEALQNAPVAFGQTYAQAAAKPLDYFRQGTAGTNPIFAAIAGETAVGSAALAIQDGSKRAHKADLWGMYVAPAHRGTKLGVRLIEAAFDHARVTGVTQVHLHVVSDNSAAYLLYRRMGFMPYGVEPRALRHDGRYHDEIVMVRMLDGAMPAGG